jgi:hypothetical protein
VIGLQMDSSASWTCRLRGHACIEIAPAIVSRVEGRGRDAKNDRGRQPGYPPSKLGILHRLVSRTGMPRRLAAPRAARLLRL